MDSESHRTTEWEGSLESSHLLQAKAPGSVAELGLSPGALTQHPEFTRSKQWDMVTLCIGLIFFLPLKMQDQTRPQGRPLILEFVMLRLIRNHIAEKL